MHSRALIDHRSVALAAIAWRLCAGVWRAGVSAADPQAAPFTLRAIAAGSATAIITTFHVSAIRYARLIASFLTHASVIAALALWAIAAGATAAIIAAFHVSAIRLTGVLSAHLTQASVGAALTLWALATGATAAIITADHALTDGHTLNGGSARALGLRVDRFVAGRVFSRRAAGVRLLVAPSAASAAAPLCVRRSRVARHLFTSSWSHLRASASRGDEGQAHNREERNKS